MVNVYEQYFSAKAEYNSIPRHAALVMLIADSEAGNIRYEAAVTFFPHRRSKKREEALMQKFQQHIDELAQEANGTIYWEKPLREARRG